MENKKITSIVEDIKGVFDEKLDNAVLVTRVVIILVFALLPHILIASPLF